MKSPEKEVLGQCRILACLWATREFRSDILIQALPRSKMRDWLLRFWSFGCFTDTFWPIRAKQHVSVTEASRASVKTRGTEQAADGPAIWQQPGRTHATTLMAGNGRVNQPIFFGRTLLTLYEGGGATGTARRAIG
jgi:hypothetical protein